MRIRSDRRTTMTLACLLCFAGLLGGCFRTAPEPADVAQMPDGFIFDANVSQGRNVFPDRMILHQVAWSTLGEETHSSLYITEYPGPAAREEIQAARDLQEGRYSSYLDYGPLEELTIDGRTAYGWLETQYFKGDLSSREYKAVVSYDDVAYAIEFYSQDPLYREEATLKDWVTTFHGPKEAGTDWVKVLVAAILLGTPLVAALRKVFGSGQGVESQPGGSIRKSA